MADANGNFFEIQRRAYMWNKNSTLDDKVTSMLWDGDPNNVVTGNTPGETKLYVMPPGAMFFQSSGDLWLKTGTPNTWELFGISTSGIYDHGSLTGLTDDDHPQYILVDGSRGFTSTVSGVYPIEDYHLVTKEYVDNIVCSGVGGGAVTLITNETPSGALNGSNTVFNLAYIPVSGTLLVFLNGLYQEPGIGGDYLLSGSQINFDEAPLAGDILLCDYFYDGTTVSGFVIGGVTDHGSLTGLTDDDHTQYILVTGTRGFTGTVSGVTPTEDYHLTTKQYVDDTVYGLDWKDSVLDIIPVASGVQSVGNRYIASATGGGWTINNIYEWDGSQWDEDVVNEGAATWVEDEDSVYTFNGSNWVKFGNTVTHNNLSGLQGGISNEYYHLSSTMYSALTSFGGVNDAGSQHHHDGRYYTETELDAGQLDNRYYTETELDAGQLDNRYYTETEVDTISGSLQSQIDGKDNYQYWTFAIEGTPKDNITSTDVLNFVAAGGIEITRTAEDEITISGVSASGIVTDHGILTGLSDDDHPQYILVDGTRAFSSTVSGVNPTEDAHLATKYYVDQGGIDRHGRQSIGNGVSFIVVSFSDLGHTNYTVNATLENTSDSPPSIYAFIVSARTSSSFTVTFMGDTDSANYKLNWSVIED